MVRFSLRSVAVLVVALIPVTASAVPVYLGGNGVVSFGVADYGGAPVANPTYIPNNFTGLNDVLTSPGGGFLTANTEVANNIFSIGGILPGGAVWVGGGNVNGNFGSGAAYITGPAVSFSLTDINPDGAGAAAYLIASWNANYTNVGDFNDTYGSYLAFAGQLTSTLSAAAVSLRTRITGGPWGAGFDLPELVLAAAGNGNFQALGGPGGGNAAVLFNGNAFQGLAINNLGPIAIADGANFTVTSTLTVIGDPAEFSSFFDVFTEIDPALVAATGTTAPAFIAVHSDTSVPEPSTLALALLALGSTLAVRRRSGWRTKE